MTFVSYRIPQEISKQLDKEYPKFLAKTKNAKFLEAVATLFTYDEEIFTQYIEENLPNARIFSRGEPEKSVLSSALSKFKRKILGNEGDFLSYIRDRRDIFEFFCGDLCDDFFAAVERLPLFAYQFGYYRRSMRSNKALLHQSAFFECLRLFLVAERAQISLKAFLERKIPESCSDIDFAYWLSLRIDRGDAEIIALADEILCAEDSLHVITRSLITGILQSSNKDLVARLGQVLLAAQRQEGLRQAIVESMDSGRKENFVTMLKIIVDNDLLRFSSIKRAIGTWTGLVDETQADRISKKELALFYDALSDEEKQAKMLQSDDNIEHYLALWALGFHDVEQANDAATKALNDPKPHRRILASYFLTTVIKETLKAATVGLAMAKNRDNKAVQIILINHYISDWPDREIETLFQHLASDCLKEVKSESWILRNMMQGDSDLRRCPKWQDYFSSIEEAKEHFAILEEVLGQSKERSMAVENTPFPWSSVSSSADSFISRMTIIALLLVESEPLLLERILPYLPRLESYERAKIGMAVLYPPRSAKAREALIAALSDRSSEFSQIAGDFLPLLHPFSADEVRQIAGYYKYKAAPLRQALSRFFISQPTEVLEGELPMLLQSKSENLRLGGLDILLGLKNSPSRAADFEKLRHFAAQIQAPSPKEQVLIDQCLQKSRKQDNALSALYNESAPLPDLAQDLLPLSKKTGDIITLTDAELVRIVTALNQLITDNAQREYQTRWGEQSLLGDCYLNPIKGDYGQATIDDYPFPELWKKFYDEEIKTVENCLALHFFMGMSVEFDDGEEREAEEQQRCSKIVSKLLQRDFKKAYRKVAKLPYIDHCETIIDSLFTSQKDRKGIENTAHRVFDDLCQNYKLKEILVTESSWREQNYLTPLVHYSRSLNILKDALDTRCTQSTDRNEFANAFARLYQVYAKYEYGLIDGATQESDFSFLSIFHFVKAYHFGLITKDEVYREILKRNKLQAHFEDLQNALSKQQHYRLRRFKEHLDPILPSLHEINEPLLKIVLDTELMRGDAETPYSAIIGEIHEVEGIPILIRILAALGNDTLERKSSVYDWGCAKSKRSVLSYLLRRSQPAPKDDLAALKKQLKDAKIKLSDKRLCELGMYCPKWCALFEKLIDWPGFEDACFFFRAHNPEIPEKYEAEIARLTPLSLTDLKLGAFDARWFASILEKLGTERLELLYDGAKYISDGASHSRARKFVDAVLNRLDRKECEIAIEDKRNKDLLLAYTLIPLPDKQQAAYFKELLRRYKFVQKFLNDSKQFGAQRQASEAVAVTTALKNLARNAGFEDDIRFTWWIETESFENIAALFEMQSIDDYSALLQIDDTGAADLHIFKDEKKLSAVPAKIKKHPAILALTATKKECTEQLRRARKSLERAMEQEDEFTVDELLRISRHPVLAPLLRSLVLVDQKTKDLGFLQAASQTLDKLDDSKAQTLKSGDCLKIAHPYDLYQSGRWHDFQQKLMQDQIKQPFKQVFRELYLPLQEELAQDKCRRYAGHQIQALKAAATLKSRLWLADNEEGLQKVDYKRQTRACIYAIADWFSPSDIEPPTIEYLVFYEQKSHKPLKLSEVAPILFSETLRDLDLAVSVAHAGGVDPEASHSTVQMRRAIAEFTLPLFKISNVTFTDNHALIKGTRASYSIHLGSAIIHQQAGPEIAVLPVHSQHRGRIFLPFVDEDPKTAEIMAKIILFAQDDKIKDPHILAQIKPITQA